MFHPKLIFSTAMWTTTNSFRWSDMHPGDKGSRWSMSHFVPMTIQGFSRFKGSNSSASSGKKKELSQACRKNACPFWAQIPQGVHSQKKKAWFLGQNAMESGPGEASPPLQEPDRVGSSRCAKFALFFGKWVTYGHRKHCRKMSTAESSRRTHTLW